MNKKEKWLKIVLTIATIFLLLLFAWQCLDIYLVGNSSANLDESGLYIQSVYRAEDVINRLNSLRSWVIGYFILLAAVSVMIPAGIQKGRRSPMEPDNQLRLMKMKLADLPETAYAEECLRKRIGYGAVLAVLFCSVMCLCFLLNKENFTSWDLEMVMGRMLIHTLPWILISFTVVIIASSLCRRSIEREIKFLRGVPGNKVLESSEKQSSVNAVRIALYVIAAILTVLGICNGGMRDVLIKAINICTECIGLG